MVSNSMEILKISIWHTLKIEIQGKLSMYQEDNFDNDTTIKESSYKNLFY